MYNKVFLWGLKETFMLNLLATVISVLLVLGRGLKERLWHIIQYPITLKIAKFPPQIDPSRPKSTSFSTNNPYKPNLELEFLRKFEINPELSNRSETENEMSFQKS